MHSVTPMIPKAKASQTSETTTTTTTTALTRNELFSVAKTAFSHDLLMESQRHVNFLQGLHANGVSLRIPSAASMRRYSDLWLPMVATNTNNKNNNNKKKKEKTKLIPPPDVAWLWHCHRLAPMEYRRYIQGRFHNNNSNNNNTSNSNSMAALDPDDSFVFQEERDTTDDAMATRKLWSTRYPHESFFLPDNDNDDNHDDDDHITTRTLALQSQSDTISLYYSYGVLDGFNVVTAAIHQSTFLWHVSGPRFLDIEFLQDAVVRYYRFLLLSSLSLQTNPLVPTYQIDLMWHTHMLSSLQAYNTECWAICGHYFQHHHHHHHNHSFLHDPKDVSFQQTCQLWEATYQQDYAVHGALYRGEPPVSYFSSSSAKSKQDGASKSNLYSSKTAQSPFVKIESILGPNYDKTHFASSVVHIHRPWAELVHPFFLQVKDQNRFLLLLQNPPPMDGYILGSGLAGDGYYSWETREAYRLLYLRLSKQLDDSCESGMASTTNTNTNASANANTNTSTRPWNSYVYESLYYIMSILFCTTPSTPYSEPVVQASEEQRLTTTNTTTTTTNSSSSSSTNDDDDDVATTTLKVMMDQVQARMAARGPFYPLVAVARKRNRNRNQNVPFTVQEMILYCY